MSESVLGLDTSNYRTSVALVSPGGKVLFNRRELLPVPSGECGLRQSDAVYAHLKRIRPLLEEAKPLMQAFPPAAVCASIRPRDRSDSYMPVFEAGDTIGRAIAAAMSIPFFPTDHQHGHIRSALAGTGLEGEKGFLALHLSGGTTDLLFCRGEELRELGTSLDLHAGQLMDRVGVALGCGFPAGPEMERMGREAHGSGELGCAMEKGDLSCHLSGAEAQVKRWIRNGGKQPGEIAREVFDLLARTSCRMLAAGARVTGCRNALVFGGIASSELFRCLLADRLTRSRSAPRAWFGDPELSGDNAVGVALIGADRLRAARTGTDGN